MVGIAMRMADLYRRRNNPPHQHLRHERRNRRVVAERLLRITTLSRAAFSEIVVSLLSSSLNISITTSVIMLKYTVLFTAVFHLVSSQRPWHAGTAGRLPMVLPQYIDERIAAEQASQAAEVGQTVQAGQPVQPDQTIQPGQTVQSNIGVQTVQTYQPGQPIQPGLAIQPNMGVHPVQGVNEPQDTTGFAVASISNRIDGSGVNNVITARPITTLDTTTTINPADLPVDAHGDVDLVNRIKTWPRDKQPFWYINWQAIQAHRGDNTQAAQVQPNTRSFFAG